MAIKYGSKVRELMVKEMEDVLKKSKGFVLSTSGNIKASDMDGFRKKIKKAGSRHLIVKKRLTKKAFDKAGLSGFDEVLKQKKNVAMTMIHDDPVTIAKILVEFAKANTNFTLTKGYLEGQVFEASKVKQLADLPSREQLIAMMLRAMNGPVSGFAGVMASILRSLCYALNAVKDKKGASAQQPVG